MVYNIFKLPNLLLKLDCFERTKVSTKFLTVHYSFLNEFALYCHATWCHVWMISRRGREKTFLDIQFIYLFILHFHVKTLEKLFSFEKFSAPRWRKLFAPSAARWNFSSSLYRKCILKIEGREWRKESETGTTIYRNKLNWNFDAVEWREIYKIFKIEMRRNMIEVASALCRMERKKISIYFVSTEVSTLRIVIK